MIHRTPSNLDSRKKYLQIALNSTLGEARKIISALPTSDRILLEVGTPMIKHYGVDAIKKIREYYSSKLWKEYSKMNVGNIRPVGILALFMKLHEASKQSVEMKKKFKDGLVEPYIVADMKTMDRGETEVEIAAQAGASAVTALGAAPIETLDAFIENCKKNNVDAIIDMMNVPYPLTVLRSLKSLPAIVFLHRGVDEERFNREKQIPLHEIRRIKGSMDMMIGIAGGDTLREVQRSIFNDADIVVVWKSVYQSESDTSELVSGFLKAIK